MFTYSLNQIQRLLSSIKGRGQDCVKKAYLPVGWRHNTHKDLRHVHSDDRDMLNSHKTYQTECHSRYIYLPSLTRWFENVTIHHSTEPNQALPRKEAHIPPHYVVAFSSRSSQA